MATLIWSESWKRRIFLRETAFATGCFTVAIYVYFLTANWGVRDYLVEGPLKDYLTHPAVHLEHLLAAGLFGLLLTVTNRLAERAWLRSRSFGVVILVRTVLYLAGLAVVFLVVVSLFLATSLLTPEALRRTLLSFSPRYLLSIGLWLGLVATGVNALLEVRRLIGGGDLWRLLVGHYRQPRDEDRSFLFMDLEGSTAIAEELGHRRYSAFIQECFRDLTSVAVRYGGKIYQYVGDEVVMTWPAETEGGPARSVKTFFAYERLLEQRTPAYLARYGVAPRFRGGIDVGRVMAAEVGEVKRAIAYHGDVLNTASRILDLCKERDGRLLVSAPVQEAVAGDAAIQAQELDSVQMKGKNEAVKVFSLVLATLLALVIPPGLATPASGLGAQEPGPAASASAALLAGARQHLLVVTETPDAIQGRLYRMERTAEGWRQVGEAVLVVVGRSGVGPKVEGDGRSPQGIFGLGRAFGYASAPPPGSGLPYEPQAPGAVCVDDVRSAFYNRVFNADTLSAPRDWESAEAMRRDLAHEDDLYEWGVVVRYNEAAEPGAGSCIFLHVRRGPDSPTAGCTAMGREELLEVMAWLRAGADPVLIQGTRAYLEGLRDDGVLPYRIPLGPLISAP